MIDIKVKKKLMDKVMVDAEIILEKDGKAIAFSLSEYIETTEKIDKMLTGKS